MRERLFFQPYRTMAYTTAQLIDILDQEMRASYQGKRVLLSARDRFPDDPVLSLALGANKISKVYAYREFREQIHAYQHEHQVSGLIWRTCRFNGVEVSFPEVHNQLIAIPSDLAQLRDSKAVVMTFWQQVSASLTLWLMGQEPQRLSPELVEELAKAAEWAEVDAGLTEVYLGLCWGKPEERHCQWALPDSGCRRIVAAPGEPSVLKV